MRTQFVWRRGRLAARNFTITRKVRVPVSLIRKSTGREQPGLVTAGKLQKMLLPDRVMWGQETTNNTKGH